jgi:hypothetical protein
MLSQEKSGNPGLRAVEKSSEFRRFFIVVVVIEVINNVGLAHSYSREKLKIRVQIPPLHFGPGLPDALFSNQNPDLGTFWRALKWKMCLFYVTIRKNLRPFGIIYGCSV